jgi:TRAP-type transport system small permease protein
MRVIAGLTPSIFITNGKGYFLMVILDRSIRWIETTLSIFSLMAIVVLVLVQVFYRYVLSSGILWANELITSLMLLMVMVGAALAARQNAHTSMTLLADTLPKTLSRLVHGIALLVTLIFLISLIMTSTSYAWQSRALYSTMLEIPMPILYGILPLGSILMLYELVKVPVMKLNLQREESI